MKISIIGAGNVGGLTAMRLLHEGLGDIYLIDILGSLAEAKALDLDDARAILKVNYNIKASGDLKEIEGSDIIIVTAGLARKPGMTREDLMNKNAAILKDICSIIKQSAHSAIVILVTNPLDLMTYFTFKTLGFDPKRIFGMGISLDASRFANLIAKELNISPLDVEACVIGVHGEGMLPISRFTNIKGVILQHRKVYNILPKSPPDLLRTSQRVVPVCRQCRVWPPMAKAKSKRLGLRKSHRIGNRKLSPKAIFLDEFLSKEKIQELAKMTVERGAKIVSLLGTGSAYFAPSAAIANIARIIVKDEKRTVGVSAYLNGEYGIKNVCLGVPCRLGRKGIEEIIELDLNRQEREKLAKSADNLKEQYNKLKEV